VVNLKVGAFLMRAFEVTLNGANLCVAGFDADSVLTAIVDYVSRHDELELRVGGLNSETREHWDWIVQKLLVGDTVQIRIVEVADADPPTKRYLG
jgi:hypothetical protein